MERALATAWWRPHHAADSTPPQAVPVAATGPFAFRALLFLTFIVVLAPQAYLAALQPLRIAFVTAGVAILAYIAQRISARRALLDMGPEMKLVACLAAWAVLTLPWSYWPGGSLAFLVGTFAKTLVLFVLLAQVVDNAARLKTMAWALALMGVPLALVAVRNFLTGGAQARIIGYDAPLTANPNDLALMLNLMLPMAIALFLSARRLGMRLLLGGTICLLAGAIVLTFSRSGFLVLAVIATIYLWKLFRRGQGGLAALALAVMLGSIPFLPSTYLDRLGTIVNIAADTSGSAQERWADTMAATSFVASNPVVGAGIGQSALAMNETRGAAWLRVHNVYLEYGVDLGLPGLILFVLLLVSCLRATGIALRSPLARDGPEAFRDIVEAIRVSLIAFAVAAPFYPAAYHFYFYMFAGLAIAARSIATERA